MKIKKNHYAEGQEELDFRQVAIETDDGDRYVVKPGPGGVGLTLMRSEGPMVLRAACSNVIHIRKDED